MAAITTLQQASAIRSGIIQARKDFEDRILKQAEPFPQYSALESSDYGLFLRAWERTYGKLLLAWDHSH